MLSETKYEFTREEQKALVETVADSPLEEIGLGSVHAVSFGQDRVLVTWQGAVVIPRIQLDAIMRTVEVERSTEHPDGSRS